MIAEEWYRSFYNYYYDNWDNGLRIKQLEAQSYNKDKEWTKVIKNFLQSLADHLGYKISQETVRIDHMWKKENDIIAIEHENNPDGIMKEVENLNAIQANLKVLITYFSEDDYSWRPYRELQKIRKKLTLSNNSEFLLVYASWGKEGNSYDWVGYRIYPEVDLKIDTISPK